MAIQPRLTFEKARGVCCCLSVPSVGISITARNIVLNNVEAVGLRTSVSFSTSFGSSRKILQKVSLSEDTVYLSTGNTTKETYCDQLNCIRSRFFDILFSRRSILHTSDFPWKLFYISKSVYCIQINIYRTFGTQYQASQICSTPQFSRCSTIDRWVRSNMVGMYQRRRHPS